MTGDDTGRSADEILADLGLTSVPAGQESEPVFGAAIGGGNLEEESPGEAGETAAATDTDGAVATATAAVDLDVPTLQAAVDDMVAELAGGLGATAIWDRATEHVYVEMEAPPSAPNLFNNLTKEIGHALDTAGFPDINRYFLIDLKDGIMIVIIKHREDILQGILVSAENANLGSLFGFVIPEQQRAVEAARRDG